MSKILIDGKSYKVTENLGSGQIGIPAKMVETDDGEKVAVKQHGKWRFWDLKDRLGIKK